MKIIYIIISIIFIVKQILKIIYIFLDFFQNNGDNKNMDAINARIKELREKLGLNQTEFANKIGVTSQFISTIEGGKAKFTRDKIQLVCLTFGVQEEWLRDGVGDMMDDEALLSNQEYQLLELFRKLSPRAREFLIEYAKKLISDEEALRSGAIAEVNPIHEKTRG
jgi:transcriptional regulator with XRE-family HTH domain